VEKLTWSEFEMKFEPECRSALRANRLKEGCAAMVLFENHMFDSSAFGRRTGIMVGPGCTYGTWQECEGGHLNDLPSQRQQAVAYTEDKPDGPAYYWTAAERVKLEEYIAALKRVSPSGCSCAAAVEVLARQKRSWRARIVYWKPVGFCVVSKGAVVFMEKEPEGYRGKEGPCHEPSTKT
jgi:hypothetical protein